ncbi:MAG: aminotransferase class IV [Alphaproteobacteria bacterium]|nr:aminotransferase class IV [Alphaproteobacteria bacterium]
MKRLINGEPEGRLDPEDVGFLRGLTIFETWRSYSEVPFRLEAHLERLVASAASATLPPPDLGVLRAELEQVAGPDHVTRVHLTAGGQRVVSGRPVDPLYVRKPIRAAWHEVLPGRGMPGSVKHTSRADWLVAARRAGVDEVLLVTPEGELLESNLSNVIAVIDGALVTPPADGRSLPGVTRAAMLEAAAEAGLPMREEKLLRGQQLEALYVCSTLKELSPVVELDGRAQPALHPLGEALHAAFRALVARECAT